MSVTTTGCPRYMAVPHDPAFGPMHRFGKARGGTVPHVLPVLVKEQNRAKQASKLAFHNAHQVLQYSLEVRIARYHLQDMTLSVTQRLDTLVFTHVHQDTHEFASVAGRFQNRMTYPEHVSRRSIRKNDSKM